MIKQIKRHKRGFTLIEVLLVAGILAVLAAFAIPALYSQARQAKEDIAKAAVGQAGPIAKALEAYRYDMGAYPDSDEGLAALMQKKADVDDERYEGPYIQNDELKDPWGHDFRYRSPGEFHEDSYDLWSTGQDGKDDEGKEGSDDVKNWKET